MASADELRWQSYRDFTGGLWDRGNDREVAENGLLELTDAYPLPTGGLRAGPHWRDEVVEGIADSEVAGFIISQLAPSDAGAGTGTHNQYIAARTSASSNMVIYHRQSTFAQPASTVETGFPVESGPPGTPTLPALTTWTTIRSHPDAGGDPLRFLVYYTTVGGGDRNVYYSVPESSTTNQGVFRIAGTSGTSVTHLTTIGMYFLAAHQDRLVGVSTENLDSSGVGVVSQTREFLRWTDPGGESFTTQDFLLLAPSQSGNITYMQPSYPSDLAVLKAETGIFYVQGPLLNPSVRGVNEIEPTEQRTWGAVTPIGVVYMTKNRGVWAWGGGTQIQRLSPQFTGTPMATRRLISSAIGIPRDFLGSCTYADRRIWFPNGYVYELDLNCWWRMTLPHTDERAAYPFWFVVPEQGRLFALGNEVTVGETRTGPVRLITTRYNERDMERVSSYSFTLPLIYQPSRDLTLRELEYHIETFTERATVDVTITRPNPDTGEDQSFELPQTVVEGTGKHPVRVQVGRNPGSANAEWWKVRTTISADPAEEQVLVARRSAESVTELTEFVGRSAEAPMLERMLVGWQEGTRYKVG